MSRPRPCPGAAVAHIQLGSRHPLSRGARPHGRAGPARDLHAPVDPYLDVAGIMKKLDGGPALLFSQVNGHDMPVVGNLLSCQANCRGGLRHRLPRRARLRRPGARRSEAAGAGRAGAGAGARPHRRTSIIGRMLPALHHTAADAGRYVTAGIVIARDPDTGVYNASYHRLMLAGPQPRRHPARLRPAPAARVRARPEEGPAPAGRGLHRRRPRAALHRGHHGLADAGERRRARGRRRPVRPAAAGGEGGVAGPAGAGRERDRARRRAADRRDRDGRAVRRVRRLSGAGRSRTGASRSPRSRTATKPIYHAINGYGRETVVLRKYVLEASLLKVLQSAVPIVTDAEMTAGGLHRFHAIVQVKKTGADPRRPAAQRHPGVVRRAEGPRHGDRGRRRHRHPRSGRRGICAGDAHGGVEGHLHGAGRARPRVCPRRPIAASAPSSASTPRCRSPRRRASRAASSSRWRSTPRR